MKNFLQQYWFKLAILLVLGATSVSYFAINTKNNTANVLSSIVESPLVIHSESPTPTASPTGTNPQTQKATVKKTTPIATQVYTPNPTFLPNPTSIPIKTWEDLEKETFLQWDQQGLTGGRWISRLGEKRYYRKEGNQWVRKNSEAEASAPYVSNQLVYSELAKTIDQINSTYERQFQQLMDNWDSLQAELKPIFDAQNKNWAEQEAKGCMGYVIGQTLTECNNLMNQWNQYSRQIDELSFKYGYGSSPQQPTVPHYLPQASTWYLEADPNGMSGKLWSTSGNQMRYECLGTYCKISSY